MTMSSRKVKQQLSSFDDTTLFYKYFLRLIAVLPFKGHDYNYLATQVLLVYFLFISCIQWSSFLFYCINEGTTIDGISETVAVLGMSARYYLLLWHRRELAILLKDCRRIWNELCDDDEDNRRTVRQFERKVRVLFCFILGSLVSAAMLYASTAVNLTLKAARNNNGTDPPHHYLPYRWFTEGAQDFWPGYKINFLLAEIVGLSSSVIFTSVDTAAPLLVMIGVGYLRAFQFRLNRTYENAITENGDSDADQELVACARLHQRILNYCTGIDKITRSLFFIQLLTTTYNLSLVMIKLAGSDPDRYKYVPLALQTLSQQFLCQWPPDRLASESEAVSTVIYSVSVPWIKRRMGKVLVLMIARAQRPVQITAAGVVYLSLENFGKTLKGAVSFFMVLRSLTS